MTTASDREAEYRRQVVNYLTEIQLARDWNQSELARQGKIHPSAINKVLKNQKHSLGWDVIENLEVASGIKIPLELRTAYRLRRVASERATIEQQIRDIPYMPRVIELTAQIHVEKDPSRKAELQRELQELIASAG